MYTLTEFNEVHYLEVMLNLKYNTTTKSCLRSSLKRGGKTK